jgi:hypothetical protein
MRPLAIFRAGQEFHIPVVWRGLDFANFAFRSRKIMLLTLVAEAWR